MFKEYHGTFRNKQCEIMQLNEDCQCDRDLKVEDACICMAEHVDFEAKFSRMVCPMCIVEKDCEHTTQKERQLAYDETDAGKEALAIEETVFARMSLTWVPKKEGATHAEWVDEPLEKMAVYMCVACGGVDTDGDGTVRFYPAEGFPAEPGWHPAHVNERPLCVFCTDKWEEACYEGQATS